MEVKGKGGISAKIVADSISSVNGKRITTYELEYPRFIHSELMTHRMFSRNAASSRAIPTKKIIEQVEDNPAMPIHWGMNQAGMQAKEELSEPSKHHVQVSWYMSSQQAARVAEDMSSEGAHKQIVNRILEPYQFIKVVLTATEFDNFFWLRCHEDSQPEFRELADCMYKARQQSAPQELDPGEWHVPYVDYTKGLGYTIPVDNDYENGRIDLTLEEALKVSASCCAQVSYRVLDNSVEKACKIYDQLVESKPVHASPFEHQATPVEEVEYEIDWEQDYTHAIGTPSRGITHYDREGDAWSGNFKGWVQHRQLIPDNVCWEYSDTDA